MSKQTPDNACTQPPATTSFLTTDTTAWLWFLVSNVAVGDDYSVAFYTPAGQHFTAMDSDWGYEQVPGNWCYAVGMSIAGNTPATLPGAWNAYIYNKGSQIYKEPFTITGSTTCSYSLSSNSASAAATGGSGSFSVTAGTGCAWSATSNATWLTTSSSGSGGGTVNYTVAANNSTSSRTGTITVGGQTFTVTQAAASAETQIFTNFNSAACSQTGSSQFTLTNAANVTRWGVWYYWSTGETGVAATVKQGSTTLFSGNLTRASCDPYQTSWCDAEAAVNATWPGGAYTVSINPAHMCMNSGSSNQGFVYIYGTTGTASTVYYRFENGTANATAAGSGSIVDSMGSGQNGTPSGTVTYSSDVPLSTVGGAADTLSLNLATSGSVQFPGAFPLNSLTNATLEFYIKPTGTGSEMDFLWTRTDSNDANRFNMGVVTSGQSRTIFLDYREPNGTLHSVAPSIAIAGSGWTHVAVVKSGNTWTAYANGVQQGQAVTDASPNLPTNTGWTLNGRGLNQFVGLLDELRISNSALTPAQFLVPPSAGTCTYSLSASSASPGAAQTTGSVTVTASGTSCTWTAGSNVSWISITSATSFTGNGTVTYSVAANTGAARSGTLTIAGQTYTVNQAAAACSYSIAPTSYSMAAQGGSSSFAVTAGSACSWTASVSSTASSWLHLGSTTSGSGNGSVSFTGDANTSMASRTGTIAIASLTFTVTQAGGASATAPTIGGIVNALDYRGGSIAQGSFFTIFGTNLGPTVGQGVTQFPFLPNLGGVTVTVTQGSITKQAYPHYVCATQINAIMPSDAPLGNVQIAVTYNGVIGAAAAATVVNNAFGIMGVGSGPGEIQNYNSATDEPVNTASKPAKPGQIEIIWGTGLGPISTPDNQPPPAGAPTTPVQVLVGGIPANLQYSGRAPGFPAVDSIYFTVPANAPLGCYVPVQVKAGGTWSNTVRMAISSDGSHCQDTFNPFAGLSSTGGKSGTLGLIRVNFTDQLGQTGVPSAMIDMGIGAFALSGSGGDGAYSPITNLPPPGTCVATNKMLDLTTVMDSGGSSLDPTIAKGLDAGPQLTVTGGAGGATGTLSRDTDDEGPNAPYSAGLGGILNVSGASMAPPFLDGGPFTISGPGGKDVGPFSTTIALAPVIHWTNPPSTINRSSPLTLTWTGGNSNQLVLILGGTTDTTSHASGGFTCLAQAAPGTFTVPANALTDMIPVGPATDTNGPFGLLGLMPLQPVNMQLKPLPTGLDVGVAFDTTMTVQTVQVQ